MKHMHILLYTHASDTSVFLSISDSLQLRTVRFVAFDCFPDTISEWFIPYDDCLRLRNRSFDSCRLRTSLPGCTNERHPTGRFMQIPEAAVATTPQSNISRSGPNKLLTSRSNDQIVDVFAARSKSMIWCFREEGGVGKSSWEVDCHAGGYSTVCSRKIRLYSPGL